MVVMETATGRSRRRPSAGRAQRGYLRLPLAGVLPLTSSARSFSISSLPLSALTSGYSPSSHSPLQVIPAFVVGPSVVLFERRQRRS